MFWIGVMMAVPSTATTADAPAAWQPFSHVSFRHHTEEAVRFATSLAQDREGFLWLGTQTGLVRWDGFRVRRYVADPEREGSLPDGYIQTVHVDTGGRLWIGTSAGGLARYDAARDRFVGIPVGPGGLGHARVASIVDDGAGGIWVGTGAGLERVDAGGRVHGAASGAPQLAAPALPADGVDVLLRDRQGGLWIGTREGLFYRSDDHARLDVVHFGLPTPNEPSINALYQDNAGRVWIGTRTHGAFVIASPGAAPSAIVETGPQAALQSERVCSIVQKDDDTIWLGTESGGIVEVDVRRGTTRRLRYRGDVPDSLRSDEATAMLRERGGQIFVASGSTLSQHDPRPHGVVTVRTIGTVTGLNIYHLLPRPDGTVWLSVPGGAVSIVDPHTGAVRELKAGGSGLPKGRVLAMANAPDGSVYIGTQQGLYRSDGAGRTVQRVEIAGRRPDASVWALAWRDDVLWLGGLDGAWAVRPSPTGPAAVVRHEHEALGDRRVTALLPLADGTVWVGTRRGIVRLDRDGTTVERLPSDNADRTRVPNGFVSSLLIDRTGRLWVSSYGNGIAFLDHTDAGGRRWFRRLTRADGLPDNSVNVMVQDRNGRIWLSTDLGLAGVHPDTLQVRRLGEADGVHVPAYWTSSGALGADGEVLFGGINGLSVVLPDRLDTRRPLPPLAVTQLMLGGRAIHAPAPDAALTVTPADRERGFAVEFAALDYMPAEYRHYAYQLEGFDTAWIDADTAVRRASYNNLPPGTYRLRVRATADTEDTASLELPVRVLLAWHQLTWVRALGALAVLGVLAALVQARTSLLRRRQRELEAVVASRTAELRATQLQLETMAYNDALTDLPNRRRFNDELHRLAALGKRGGEPFALLLIDLDRFKHINDTLGHDAGDALLVAAAERLRAAVRQTDCVARLGGDEFAVLLTPASDAIVGDVAQRIIESMRAPITFGSHVMHVSASIGAAVAWRDGDDTEGLYKKADTALYCAKEAGRDTWCRFGDATV
jgi:diguanylate cyclase (GGDEF)-like protein